MATNGRDLSTRRGFLGIGTGMAAPLACASSLQRAGYRVFSEGRIGSLRVKNRLVKAATAEGAGNGGVLSAPGIEMYRSVARGGVGMIITGGMVVVPSGTAGRRLVWIFDDRFTHSIREIARAIHETDPSCKVIAQLCHLGVQGDEAVGPSARNWPWSVRQPRPLAPAEIQEVVTRHAQAARRVREAGFDGVQIHAAHGYLLSAFLSPYTNARGDDYGGSLRGRAAIISEIVGQARTLAGQDFPILIKVNCDDHVTGGIDITSFPALAGEIEKSGVHALEVSGNQPGRQPVAVADQQSYYLRFLEKRRPGIPVILTGGNRSVQRLESILKSGKADFFGLGRPLLREQGLPRRWLEGRGGPESTCISCNSCLRGLSKGLVTRCRLEDSDD